MEKVQMQGMPETIEVRRRFLTEDKRISMIAKSAMDGSYHACISFVCVDTVYDMPQPIIDRCLELGMIDETKKAGSKETKLKKLAAALMADCATLESELSHWVPEFVGSLISTLLIAIGIFTFDWRMALASLWVLPVSPAHVLRLYDFGLPCLRPADWGEWLRTVRW